MRDGDRVQRFRGGAEPPPPSHTSHIFGDLLHTVRCCSKNRNPTGLHLDVDTTSTALRSWGSGHKIHRLPVYLTDICSLVSISQKFSAEPRRHDIETASIPGRGRSQRYNKPYRLLPVLEREQNGTPPRRWPANLTVPRGAVYIFDVSPGNFSTLFIRPVPFPFHFRRGPLAVSPWQQLGGAP